MRVLVVRAAQQAQATAAALAGAGHVPLVAPILAIVPTTAAPPERRPDAVLVTSRNAVAALARHRDAFTDIPFFAVGPRTAKALRAAGFGRITVAGGDGIDLARLLRATVPRGSRLLHVAGRERRPEPGASLAASGRALDVWEAYAADAVETLPAAAREALGAGALDAVLHYSPRSAGLLRRLVAQAGLAAPFAALRHICLSQNVAAALTDVPPERLQVAAAPHEASLLALLAPDRRAD